jgi:hypothetical protein
MAGLHDVVHSCSFSEISLFFRLVGVSVEVEESRALGLERSGWTWADQYAFVCYSYFAPFAVTCSWWNDFCSVH